MFPVVVAESAGNGMDERGEKRPELRMDSGLKIPVSGLFGGKSGSLSFGRAKNPLVNSRKSSFRRFTGFFLFVPRETVAGVILYPQCRTVLSVGARCYAGERHAA